MSQKKTKRKPFKNARKCKAMPRTKKRVRLNPARVEAEAARVLTFTMDQLVPAKGRRTFVADAYRAYQGWLGKRKMPKAAVSLDGFGRLLPGGLERKTASIKGRMGRVLLGVAIRG